MKNERRGRKKKKKRIRTESQSQRGSRCREPAERLVSDWPRSLKTWPAVLITCFYFSLLSEHIFHTNSNIVIPFLTTKWNSIFVDSTPLAGNWVTWFKKNVHTFRKVRQKRSLKWSGTKKRKLEMNQERRKWKITLTKDSKRKTLKSKLEIKSSWRIVNHWKIKPKRRDPW